MKASVVSAATALCLLIFTVAIGTNTRDTHYSSPAEPIPQLINNDQWTTPLAKVANSTTDSLYLLGGPGVLSGKFQNSEGQPDRQGWTGIDINQRTEIHWQTSTFNAAELDPATDNNHAWWCGDIFESCNEDDPPEGYGDNWYQNLDWYGVVPNTAQDVTVRIQAVISYDIEPGEEFLRLMVNNSEYMETLQSYTFSATATIVDISTTVTPDYFVGQQSDQIHLRWNFSSDGAWSDEDCRWATAGAAQLDLIQVSFDQGDGPVQIGTTETSEPGDALQWQPALPRGPGDFSKVWPQLDDADPSTQNNSPQFAFIDDGQVVPGTGGFLCTTHCYGPGGFIVNPIGGMSELYTSINNEIWSPVIGVPQGDWNAAIFSFDQYVHADLSNNGPYVLGLWHVRSTADPTGIDGWSDWQDHNLALWGEPRYVRNLENVTELLVPGFTHVQLALGVMQFYGYLGRTDGTPAPYFDNVSFKVYHNEAPSSLLVQADGSGDYPDIQTAINAAAELDTVLLADGVFTGEGNRNLLLFGKEIVISSQSGNPENCILDLEGLSGNRDRGFRFSYEEGPGTVVTGLTITNGYQDLPSSSLAYSGGAIACLSGTSPTISNCIFINNSALGLEQQGGAIFCDDASPLITGCQFVGNTADRGGAIGVTGLSNPIISNCLFTGNEGIDFGGAVFSHGEEAYVTISSCTLAENTNPFNSGTLSSYTHGQFSVDHTIIAFGEVGYSAFVTAPADIQFSCSNLYGNTRGDWHGHFADQLGTNGNISLDPLFCVDNTPSRPFSINEESPCRPTFNPDCGLIGAYHVSCGSISSVLDNSAQNQQARFSSCYPNPFNPRTTLSFILPQANHVQLRIYGLNGRLITTLVNETMTSGPHEICWNGQDEHGWAVASGVFFGRLKTDTHEDSIRMVLLK